MTRNSALHAAGFLADFATAFATPIANMLHNEAVSLVVLATTGHAAPPMAKPLLGAMATGIVANYAWALTGVALVLLSVFVGSVFVGMWGETEQTATVDQRAQNFGLQAVANELLPPLVVRAKVVEEKSLGEFYVLVGGLVVGLVALVTWPEEQDLMFSSKRRSLVNGCSPPSTLARRRPFERSPLRAAGAPAQSQRG
jgi:hypothetical protein